MKDRDTGQVWQHCVRCGAKVTPKVDFTQLLTRNPRKETECLNAPKLDVTAHSRTNVDSSPM